MDDGAALVREVLAEAPAEARGVRAEWGSHEGWHRKEDVGHRSPAALLLPVATGAADSPAERRHDRGHDRDRGHGSDNDGNHDSNNHDRGSRGGMDVIDVRVPRSVLREEAEVKAMIHEQVLLEEAEEAAAAAVDAAADPAAAAAADATASASNVPNVGVATIPAAAPATTPAVIADHASKQHGEAWGFNGKISGPLDGTATTPAAMPPPPRHHLRGALRHEIILPSTGPYLEDTAAPHYLHRPPLGALAVLAAAGSALAWMCLRSRHRGRKGRASGRLRGASSLSSTPWWEWVSAALRGADVSTTSERLTERRMEMAFRGPDRKEV
jgi:hypothetical protein